MATIKIIKGKTHCLQFPFEAISQTEFLSFDQLSQSSCIYLVGEPGTPSPHGTVHSTRPPELLNTARSSPPGPVVPSTANDPKFSQSHSEQAIRFPLYRQETWGSEKLRDFPRVHNLLMKNWVGIEVQFSKPRALPHHISSPQTFGLRHLLQS